ncbi:MAG TPA: cell division protein SepF [Micromonosporaceae bacterium]|nr:cell division protein SepF [Micromonosporaceae bacterium]HCU51654.1 cell division protein SepF [Micromonosporaceae bacterium]
MGALRKAGVWLGLVEDEDDLEYDDATGDAYDKPYSRYRSGSESPAARGALRRADERSRDRYEDEFEDDDDLEVAPVTRARAERTNRLGLEDEREVTVPRGPVASQTRLGGVEARLEQARSERATVRPITTRPVTASTTSSPTTSTRDNLALAPQPLQRTSPALDDDRRTQITTLHPTTYNEARQIGERFRDGSPVIMNLTEMDEADAKRLVDFAAGLAFGLRGTIERVTNRVFLLSPANVQVTAEDKAKIAEGGFFRSTD